MLFWHSVLLLISGTYFTVANSKKSLNNAGPFDVKLKYAWDDKITDIEHDKPRVLSKPSVNLFIEARSNYVVHCIVKIVVDDPISKNSEGEYLPLLSLFYLKDHHGNNDSTQIDDETNYNIDWTILHAIK